MSIRSLALDWLAANHPDAPVIRVGTSRYYLPEGSWTKRDAWAFEIALKDLQATPEGSFILLGQQSPDSADFHYLSVPAQYLTQYLPELHIRTGQRISLFLSAELDTLFVDQRGSGQVPFQQFLQPLTATEE